MVEKTRRELLAEAFDASEKDDDEVIVAEHTEDLGESGEDGVRSDGDSAEGASDKGGGVPLEGSKDVLGKEKKTQEVGKKSAPTDEEKQEAEAARKDAEGKPGKEGQPTTDKAPNSWKPAIREHWGKIPAEARAEINRREKEIQVTLSQTANIRKFAGDFATVVNPFSHLIRSQGSTPLQAVHNLMTTAAGLTTGTEEQKASIVAEIVQNFGIDCEILDQILSAVAQKNGGKVPRRNGAAPREHIPAWAQPLIAQNQKLAVAQEAHEQRMREEAEEEISAVETEPFFEDVKDDIADIMEISANRGRKMTVKQAYEKAVQLRPDLSKLVAQHKLASQANGRNRQNMTRARRAASTITGSPSGRVVGSAAKPQSRREALAAAWDDAEDK